VVGAVFALGVLVSLYPSVAEAGVWTSFTRAEGLAADNVKAVATSDGGTIFIAVDEFNAGRHRSSVFEYDGIRFVNLSDRYATPPDFNGDSTSCPPNPNTPANAAIVSLALAPSGDIWVATNGNGVFRLGLTDYDHFTLCDGLGENRANSILVDPNGTVWVGTHPDSDVGGGLSRFDGTSWSNMASANGILLDDILEFALAADGSIWMTHIKPGGGLTRSDGTQFENFQRPGGADPNQLWRLAIAPGGNVWVTSQSAGVGVFDSAGNWIADLTTADGLVTNITRGVAIGPHGGVWVGTRDGIQRWDGVNWDLLTASDGLISNETGVLRVDPAGVLWVATAAGLSRYEGSLWLPFNRGNGLEALQVNGLSRGALADMPPGSYAGGVTKGPVYAALSRALNGDPIFDPVGGVARITGLDVEMVMNSDSSLLERTFTAVAAVAGGAWVASRDSFYRIQGLSVMSRFPRPATVAPSEAINSLVSDPAGPVWAGTQEGGGNVASVILRYSGGSWSEYPVAGVTPSRDGVLVHDVDQAGQLWVSTSPNGGAARINPADGSHVKYTEADNNLPSNEILAILVAGNGDVWFGTVMGVGRLRGSVVERVSGAGLPSDNVFSLGEDDAGRIWAGTSAGVAYFDGNVWTSYSASDGLADITVLSMVADTSQALLGTRLGGISLFHSERVAPKSLVVSGPPATLGGRAAAFEFDGGDLDSQNGFLDLAWALDQGPMTSFAKDRVANLSNLGDGNHVFGVWARDRALNVSGPAQYLFVVDATPPQPVISSPAFGRAIDGVVPVFGDVADARFAGYRVEVSPDEESLVWEEIGLADTVPALNRPLAIWDTGGYADGDYLIRVVVADMLSLVGIATVGVVVDNESPSNEVTTPARITNAEGGRIFTLNAEVEAYFPPQTLDQDRIITLEELPEPSSVPPGASRWLAGWHFSPAQFDLKKPVTLTFSIAALDSIVQANGGPPIQNPGAIFSPRPTITLGIFAVSPDTSFSFLGGSVDPWAGTITTTINKLSGFAVFEGFFAATTTASRDVDIQPRAFSPRGNTFDTQAAISFNMNGNANVEVFVHDRSGRIVRRVFNATLGPGRNVVYWDGRDGNGEVVPSGLYLVTIKAEGETDVKSVAVVNR
jgi:ligand-binding sensor domain-containing protein